MRLTTLFFHLSCRGNVGCLLLGDRCWLLASGFQLLVASLIVSHVRRSNGYTLFNDIRKNRHNRDLIAAPRPTAGMVTCVANDQLSDALTTLPVEAQPSWKDTTVFKMKTL